MSWRKPVRVRDLRRTQPKDSPDTDQPQRETEQVPMQPDEMPETLVVKKYHTPKVAVIIPHYEYYAEFITDALLSVQQQTHQNLTCVVVDDCSSAGEFQKVRRAVDLLDDKRFSLIRADENKGQIPSVYRGLEETDADFVCILDPDDRYAPDFLARMLGVHLNPWVYCPVACCDQYLLNLSGGVIAGTCYHDNRIELSAGAIETEQSLLSKFGFHQFIPPTEPGWHWTSTSSIMFRSDALRYFRPFRTLPYKGEADSYCAQGAHMLGGSLFLREPLVYRGLHKKNAFIRNSIFSVYQKMPRNNANQFAELCKTGALNLCKIDAVEAFLHNGGLEMFDLSSVRQLIAAQFRGDAFDDLLRAVPQVADLFASGDGAADPAGAP
jgi:glycosyltransferase involved in cell wall biosynthesis